MSRDRGAAPSWAHDVARLPVPSGAGGGEHRPRMLPPLIETWAALPRKGEAYLEERQWFDVKETYGPGTHAEKAKDMSAFANGLGGALIVGATEGPTEPDYSKPLAAAWAEKVVAEFDQAVRNFCRPSPVVHVRRIPSPDAPGKVVLVVNIEAAVDQPIAARHAQDQDAWRFPIRVNRDTEFLLPEQLPLYMNSKARRAKLLLLRALSQHGEVELQTVPGGSGDYIQAGYAMQLLSVDADGGGAFVLRGLEGDFRGKEAAVPLDDVEAVWMLTSGRWAVRIGGRMETIIPSEGTEQELMYTPPGTFGSVPLKRTLERIGDRVKDIGNAISKTLVVQYFQRVEPTRGEIADRAHAMWAQRQEQLRVMEQRQRENPNPDLPMTFEDQHTPEDDWFAARRQLLAERRNG